MSGASQRKRARERREAAGLVCRCINHLGGPKQQHRTKDAALGWIVSQGLRHGAALEVYPCPTTDRWHVRSRKARPSPTPLGH